jgi:hypothetical protein
MGRELALGGMRMGLFLIGEAMPRVCSRKKGVVVVLGGAIGRMHPQIECRPSQASGSLMRGVSSLVSPQPQTAVRYGQPLYLYRQRKLDRIPPRYSLQ